MAARSKPASQKDESAQKAQSGHPPLSCSDMGNARGAQNPVLPGSTHTRQIVTVGWAEQEEGACELRVYIHIASLCALLRV